MGRPKKEIDAAKVKKLAGMGLTVEEIAAVLECNKRTLERRFVAVLKEGRQRRNASLRRRQFTVAMKGSVPMLIFLGKQYLGQRDSLLNDDQFEPDSSDKATLEGKLAAVAPARPTGQVPEVADGSGGS